MLLLVLGCSFSCDDESLVPPLCPSYQVGAVEGYVRSGGAAVVARVGARQVVSPGIVLFETRSESSGWYHLEVASGTYRIEIDPSGGGWTSTPLRDTVQVGSSTRRVDLLRGELTVRVATPARLEGHRYSCGLDPLSGLLVHGWTQGVVRNGQLEFHFSRVKSGAYRVGMGTYYPTRFWFPGTYQVEAAATITIPVDHPVLYEAALDHYASVSGTLQGSWQAAGTSSPDIEAYTDDAQLICEARADADASFWLDIFMGQTVRLRTEFQGIEQWIGGESFETATPYTLEPGQALGGLALEESGILCRLEGPGLLAMHQAEILLRDESGGTLEPRVDYGASRIPICNLRPGRYWLYAYGDCDSDGEPWASQWYDGADSLSGATPIDLGPGQMVPVTLHLSRGGVIEGRVLDSAGQSAVTAVVAVFDRYGTTRCDSPWRYAGAGTFSLGGLANGDYTLAAQTTDGPWWYPGTATLDSAGVIGIRDHATITGIEWRLPPQGRQGVAR